MPAIRSKDDAKTVTCSNASRHGFTIGNGHDHSF